MRSLAVAAAATGALALSGAAQAQNRALVLQDINPWAAGSLPTALTAEGVPYDVVGSAAFPTTNLFNYTMIFVSSCQPDALYNAWNARSIDTNTFVNIGGFIALHGSVWACGNGTGLTFPQPPGGNVTWTAAPTTTGNVLLPADPLVIGVPLAPTGNFVAFGHMGGLLPSDTTVMQGAAGPILFHREVGLGNVVVTTAWLEYAYNLGSDIAPILPNEIAWGDSVAAQCDGQPDSDGDGICDVADVCPGFNDFADTDVDGVPDGCDPCPLAASDDSDGDGVCDDVDLCLPGDDNVDVDGDNFPDDCDNCLGLVNPFQEDQDVDGIGDPCDICPRDPDDDADGDGICGDADVCQGFDDAIDQDGDGVPDGCDNCVADANSDQVDTDFDGLGDACDNCFDAGQPNDGDGDGWRNSCDNCPFTPNPLQLDGDDDGVGDSCDNCPAGANSNQFDWDFDGIGDVCDLCAFGPNELDRDGDLVPDACDPCPEDATDDSDGDGVCDSADQCPGVNDGLDSDADGTPDACDNCPEDYNQPQIDRDEDGFGSACDCDDRNPLALPGGTEVCDGADNDCNGHVDDVGGVSNLFWPDFDNDGSGDPTGQPIEACEAPFGYTVDFGDCDDKNPDRSPDAIEYCDDIDNDCDSVVDGPRCTRLSALQCGCDSGSGAPGGLVVLGGLLLVALRRRQD